MAESELLHTLEPGTPLSEEAVKAVDEARIAHDEFIKASSGVTTAKEELRKAYKRYNAAEAAFQRASTNALSLIVSGEPAKEEP